MKIKAIVVVMVATMIVPAISAVEDVVLIGNSSIKDTVLTEREVIKIFLGKKIAWDDNTRTVVAFQKKPAVHNAFLKRYIHQSPSMFANFWKRQIYTGKVSSPKYVTNDQEMIRYVSETEGAIGYVSISTGLDVVKTIRVR